ncbi:MAG: GNAT family N-acetyltransferase [Candidatus Altiarchaeota archaeon]
MRRYYYNVALRDGSKILLRPIKKSDAHFMIDLFHRFSEETIFERFFESIKDMTLDELKFYLDVDEKERFALVAELSGKGILLGVARYMGNGESAEFALVVADEWQGKGLGTLMLKHLIEIARENGVNTLTGLVFKSNSHMIHLIKMTGLPFTSCSVDNDILMYALRLF